jgi:hypothetical protein
MEKQNNKRNFDKEIRFIANKIETIGADDETVAYMKSIRRTP